MHKNEWFVQTSCNYISYFGYSFKGVIAIYNVFEKNRIVLKLGIPFNLHVSEHTKRELNKYLN